MYKMYFLYLILIIIPLLNGAMMDYKSYKDYKVYEINGNDKDITNLITFLSGIADISHNVKGKSKAEVLIPPDVHKVFSEAVDTHNLTKEMVVEDFSIIIEHEKQEVNSNESDWEYSFTNYYDVDGIYDYLLHMSKTYSNWIKLVVGGHTYEGRKILGLRINTSNDTKPIVFIESGIHAREWIAPATTTYFIHKLIFSADSAIMSLRDKFEWHIFPTVNPDGYHYSHTTDRMWRKTRSKSSDECYGADPNRNWDYNWGHSGASDDPCDYQEYAGPQPFSEIETRTLSQYILNLRNIVAYIGFHSDAQLLLMPYSDSVDPISNYQDLVKIGKTSIEYGQKVNGEVYGGPGTAAKILYSVSGGSMDWVRYTLNTSIVFTYELRGSRFTWPREKIPEQGEEVTQMLLGLFTEACKLGYC